MIEWLLRVLDRSRGAFSKMGVDYDQLRAIVEVKLKSDTRRRPGGLGQTPARASRNVLAVSLGFYTFLGAFLGLSLFAEAPLLIRLTIIHGFLMLFISMSLLTDYSSVLLDPTDNLVLLPRAVSGRTILLSRIVHVAIYVGLIVTSLGLGTMLLGAWAVGWWFPIVFALTLVASACLCTFGVSAFYLVALRWTQAERFRDVILYVQIGLVVLFVASYQLMPRLLASDRIRLISLEEQWWVYLVPPCWLAAPVDVIAGHVAAPQLVLSFLAFAVPATCVAAVLGKLAPGFGTALLRLEPSPPPTKPAAQAGRRPRPWAKRWGRLLCRAPEERASFETIWMLCRRDRPFRLRTYPTIAFVFLLPLVFFSSSQVVMGATLESLTRSPAHLFLLYLCCSLAPTAIGHLAVSEQHAASWLYRAAPLARPGGILLAGLKVVVVRLMLPTFAVIAACVLLLWGPTVFPDVVLAFAVLLLMTALQATSYERALPFSQPFEVLRSFERVRKSLLLMFLPGALGVLHLLLSYVDGGVPIATLIVLGLMAASLRGYARTSWSALAS